MAFNQFGQYVGNQKVWDHVGRVLPDFELSEGERPSIEFKPAAWLPVQFFDKHFENWMVVMPGKIVALDNDGRVVPAQYGLTEVVQGQNGDPDTIQFSGTITYTDNDVLNGVIDVRTGNALLANATGTFNVRDVTNFMGRTGEAMNVSKPIGVAPYAFLQWCGGDGFNPAQYRQHNYNMQHQVAVLCDYVVAVPLVPAQIASPEAMTFGAPAANVSTATALARLSVATNTVRTPIVFAGGSSATLFVHQVATAAQITEAGDWHIDYRTGVVKVYATVQPQNITCSYFHYASLPSAVSKFVCATGDLKPGDFVVCDTNSNYTKATGTESFTDIIGQVLSRDSAFPKDALERVKTAFSPPIRTDATGALPGTLGQLDQMAGSATGGMPADIHFAGAADTLVAINLVSR